MAVDVVTEIDIQRPSDSVAAFTSDPGNAPRWYENIASAEWETPKPLRVGSRIAFAARFLGRELRYTYEVTDHTPGHRLVMRTVEGPFPMETTYEFESKGPTCTRVRLRNRGAPAGYARLVAPFISVAMRAANRKDLRKLKSLLESF